LFTFILFSLLYLYCNITEFICIRKYHKKRSISLIEIDLLPYQKLLSCYVSRLWTTVAFNDFKLNVLTFFKRFETFSLDSREMNEYYVAVFTLDESKSFFCVIPFNFTSHHTK